MKLLIAIVVCFNFFFEVGAQLTFSGKQCGHIRCNLDQYCNSFTSNCAPCADICDKSTHNFDESKCVDQCQAYIHDLRYSRTGGADGAADGDLRATIQKLQLKVTVLLALVCILIITLVLLLCLQIWRWKKNNNVTLKTLHKKIFPKKSDNNANTAPSNGVAMNAQVGGKPDLRLDMPTSGGQSEHSPMTLTTAISRIPAEDSIDYAYDNPVMSNTSSSNRMGHASA